MIKNFLLTHLTKTDYKIINSTKGIFDKLKTPFDAKLLGLNLGIGKLMFYFITGSVAYVFISNNKNIQNKIITKMQEDEKMPLILTVGGIITIVVIMTI